MCIVAELGQETGPHELFVEFIYSFIGMIWAGATALLPVVQTAIENFLNWVEAGKLQNWTPAVFLASGGIAYLGIHINTATARKRATLDLIEKAESTAYYLESQTLFKKYVSEGRLLSLVKPTSDEETRDRRKIHQFLNHYELISIGIHKGFLDEKTYKLWMRTPFVRHWNDAADFIQQERWVEPALKQGERYHSKLYKNYERLALKWSKRSRIFFWRRPPVEARKINRSTKPSIL